jgi:hypothetical protein
VIISCCDAEELIRIKDGDPGEGFLAAMMRAATPPRRLVGRSVVASATATAALAPGQASRAEEVVYADAPIRAFTAITAFWGVVGFLVGVVIALQLAYPLLVQLPGRLIDKEG